MTKHPVFVERKAQKQLENAPKNDQQRILAVLTELQKEGLVARLDIKKLRGYNNTSESD